MDVTLTLADLLKLVLFLLGIGVLGYLLLILRNVNKVLGQAEAVLEANMDEIDTTIKQLPEITINVNKITGEAEKMIAEMSPDLTSVVKNVNGITTKVDDMAGIIDNTGHKVGDTVDVLTETIAESALAFQFNAKSVTSYIEIIKEIIEIVRDAIKKY